MNSYWDERFLRLAEYVSAWSKDPTTAVGCVVVGLDKRDVAIGYNGFPPGIADDHRLHDRDLKNAITRHAEANALTACRDRFQPNTIYVTHFPCVRKGCASQIIAEGLVRVVAPEPEGEYLVRWGDDYRLALELFREAGIDVTLLNLEGTLPMRTMTVTIRSIMMDGLPDVDRLTGRVAFIFEGGVRSGWPVPGMTDSWEDSVTGRVFLGVTHWIEFPEPLYSL